MDFEIYYNVIVIGDTSVGKTSLVQYLANNEYTRDIPPSIGVDMIIKQIEVDGHKIQLRIRDTAGQEKYSSLTRTYYRNSHAVVIMYDVTRYRTLLSLPQWRAEADRFLDEEETLYMVIGHKSDVPNHEAGREVCTEMAKDVALKTVKVPEPLFFETSSISGENVKEAFEMLARWLYGCECPLAREIRKQELKKLREAVATSVNGGCCS